MPKVFTSEKQKIGEIGESEAVAFLVKQGFRILDRNYTKKWGEIDVVAEKGDKVYFIEVKSVSRDRLDNVSYGTDEYRPEDNMHPWKLQRMSRTIQTYLLSKNIPDEKEWQVDLLVVYLDLNNNKSLIKVVSDIIL
ncbi:MAG: YraN family protein [Candidatus Pacebacteria bacterium]|nr:YraN family protein [Candidatus Paceibacterota bacterium]